MNAPRQVERRHNHPSVLILWAAQIAAIATVRTSTRSTRLAMRSPKMKERGGNLATSAVYSSLDVRSSSASAQARVHGRPIPWRRWRCDACSYVSIHPYVTIERGREVKARIRDRQFPMCERADDSDIPGIEAEAHAAVCKTCDLACCLIATPGHFGRRMFPSRALSSRQRG